MGWLISPLRTPLRTAGDSRAQIKLAELGPLQLSEVTADAEVVHRTRRLTSHSDPECYKVGVQLRGCAVLAQDGREAQLGPRDIVVYDTTRPYRLSFGDDSRMIAVMFPRTLLRMPCQELSGVTALRISGTAGVGGLVATFLTALFSQLDGLDELDASSAIRLAGNVVDLLQTMFTHHVDGLNHVSGDSHRRALMLRAFTFIEDHLGEPDMGPAMISAALHISTRYVHKLFEAEGTTVGAWIRSRRMERCRRDLGDPALSAQSVSAVGARWGLADPSRFSKLFRQTYTMSPSQYRSYALAHPAEEPGPPGGAIDT